MAKLNILIALMAVAFLSSSLGFSQKNGHLTLKGGLGKITVKGYIGGEAHDSYSIDLAAGRKMRITVSSAQGRADFTVSASADFTEGEPVKFGEYTKGKKVWSGVIPAARSYFIFVTAHPDAKYTLRVEVE
jgi:hypothetical protein